MGSIENKAAKEWLSNRGYGSGTNLTINTVAYLLTEYASQQKPETIKSDNSKINISLLEEVERLRKIETYCIKLLAYGQKQIELNREAVDLIKSDELKPEQTKVFQFRLAQGKFYGWRDSMKFLNEALNK